MRALDFFKISGFICCFIDDGMMLYSFHLVCFTGVSKTAPPEVAALEKNRSATGATTFEDPTDVLRCASLCSKTSMLP